LRGRRKGIQAKVYGRKGGHRFFPVQGGLSRGAGSPEGKLQERGKTGPGGQGKGGKSDRTPKKRPGQGVTASIPTATSRERTQETRASSRNRGPKRRI